MNVKKEKIGLVDQSVTKKKGTDHIDQSVSKKGRADHIDQLVSKRVKMRRMILGLSQQELGEAVDVSIQQVQKYEKATNRISSGKLWGFSKVLGVPVSYFYNQSEELNNTIANVFAEESEEYNSHNKLSHASEKEVLALIRAFIKVGDLHVRKKLIELVGSMT